MGDILFLLGILFASLDLCILFLGGHQKGAVGFGHLREQGLGLGGKCKCVDAELLHGVLGSCNWRIHSGFFADAGCIKPCPLAIRTNGPRILSSGNHRQVIDPKVSLDNVVASALELSSGQVRISPVSKGQLDRTALNLLKELRSVDHDLDHESVIGPPSIENDPLEVVTARARQQETLGGVIGIWMIPGHQLALGAQERGIRQGFIGGAKLGDGGVILRVVVDHIPECRGPLIHVVPLGRDLQRSRAQLDGGITIKADF